MFSLNDPKKKRSYYEILELELNASEEDVVGRCIDLVWKWRPDKKKNKNEIAKERLQEVQTACSILVNPTTRREYDAMYKETNGEYSKETSSPTDRSPKVLSKRSLGKSKEFYDNLVAVTQVKEVSDSLLNKKVIENGVEVENSTIRTKTTKEKRADGSEVVTEVKANADGTVTNKVSVNGKVVQETTSQPPKVDFSPFV